MRRNILGVVGGLGPLATTRFMELVIAMTDARTDQENADMIVYNFPSIPDRTGYILGSNLKSPLPGLKCVAQALARQKVSCIAIPCVTAHYFHRELQSTISVPILNGVAETISLLKAHGIRKAGIMATDGTIRSRLLSRELDNAGIIPVIPSAKRQEDVMHLIYENVKAGKNVRIGKEPSMVDATEETSITAGNNINVEATKGKLLITDSTDIIANNDVSLKSYETITFGKQGAGNINIDNSNTIKAGNDMFITSTNGDINAEKTTMPELQYGNELTFNAKGSNNFTSENSLKSVICPQKRHLHR